MTVHPTQASRHLRRILPDRPSLEHQKKLAKELLKEALGGVPEARERLLAAHPAPSSMADRPPRLADAQLVLAREYGLASWRALREHILELQRMANQIDGQSPAPDHDASTLHLRCGSDIREGLLQAGFGGAFLKFVDPLCRGPLSDAPLEAYLTLRAEFISSWGGSAAEARERLAREYAELNAAADYDRLVMWFEHDPYDQLILARVLSLIGALVGDHADASSSAARPRTIELILLDDYPGVGRFMGLGQLPPQALRSLWKKRVPVTSAMIKAGQDVWAALVASNPLELTHLVRTGTRALPMMAGALRRHLQELPGIDDGLSLLERLTLQTLAARPLKGAELFRGVMQADPLPFIGDSMLMEVLEALLSGDRPAIQMGTVESRLAELDPPWPRREWSLTDHGRALLTGSVDWLSTRPMPRWVGGVRVNAGEGPVWRWSESAQEATRR